MGSGILLTTLKLDISPSETAKYIEIYTEVLVAVIKSAASRLRPILLTSITTVVGLLPLAYGIGGTDAYIGPMSLTLGYGLLFSLPVVLIVIPCLYTLFLVAIALNKVFSARSELSWISLSPSVK